jgi:hypothetical protein
MKDELIIKAEKDVIEEQRYSDGIPQIVVGLFLVFTMLTMLGSRGSYFVVFIPIVPLLIEGLRKRITYPRVGFAQIRDRGSRRQVLIWLVLAVLIGLAVAYFLLQRGLEALPPDSFLWKVPMYGVAGIIVLLAVAVTIRKRAWQYLWYSATVVLIIAAILLLKPGRLTVIWAILAFGVLHAMVGTVNLIRFIRKYPVLKDE